jgi:hypothetical protein
LVGEWEMRKTRTTVEGRKSERCSWNVLFLCLLYFGCFPIPFFLSTLLLFTSTFYYQSFLLFLFFCFSIS